MVKYWINFGLVSVSETELNFQLLSILFNFNGDVSATDLNEVFDVVWTHLGLLTEVLDCPTILSPILVTYGVP